MLSPAQIGKFTAKWMRNGISFIVWSGGTVLCKYQPCINLWMTNFFGPHPMDSPISPLNGLTSIQFRLPVFYLGQVTVDMSFHTQLGLDVDWANDKSLYVRHLQAGAVEEWNRQCLDFRWKMLPCQFPPRPFSFFRFADSWNLAHWLNNYTLYVNILYRYVHVTMYTTYNLHST